MADATCYMCFEEKQLNNDGTSCWCDSALEAVAYPRCLRGMLRHAVVEHADLLPTSGERLGTILDAFDGASSGVMRRSPISSAARLLYKDVSKDDIGMRASTVMAFMQAVTAFLRDVCKQDVRFYGAHDEAPMERVEQGLATIVAYRWRASQAIRESKAVAVVLSMPVMCVGTQGHAFSYIRCNEDPEYWMLANAYRDKTIGPGDLVHTTIAFRDKGVFNPMSDELVTSSRFSIRYGVLPANAQSPQCTQCIIVYGLVPQVARPLAWPPRIPRLEREGARAAILRHVFPQIQGAAASLEDACVQLGSAAAYTDAADSAFVEKAKATGKVCIEVPLLVEDEFHLMAIVLHKGAEDNEWALFDEDDDTRPALIFESRLFDIFHARAGSTPIATHFNIAYHGKTLGLLGARCAYATGEDPATS